MENSKFEGLLIVSELESKNISRDKIYKFIKDNNYEKVGPGIYVPKNELTDELSVLHKRCPKGIFSHDEALYHYGLIDREPLKHTITVYSGFNCSRLKNENCKFYYVDKSLLEMGKKVVTNNFGNAVPMYDIDRTIVDMVRNRRQFEIQDFTTALRTYAKHTDKNLKQLYDYAKEFKVEKIIREYLEVLI
ncbi:MAG: abortive phage infection protein [Erysipelotrichaceae bacterium]|nr:abortive phage infection protein [Erysipelotrichaceae bacterium]